MRDSSLQPPAPNPKLSALYGWRDYGSGPIKNGTHLHSPMKTFGGGQRPTLESTSPDIRYRADFRRISRLIGCGYPEKKFPSLRHFFTLVSLCVFGWRWREGGAVFPDDSGRRGGGGCPYQPFSWPPYEAPVVIARCPFFADFG